MSTPDSPVNALSALIHTPMPELVQAIDAAREGAYHHFQIAKGDGRFRQISEPPAPLKTVQSRILQHLLNHVPVSPFAHGYVPGRSIVTNARIHARTAVGLVSVDLQDAFPSVDQRRVERMLQWFLGPLLKVEHPTLSNELRSDVYSLLATLCCLDGSLPQGAPSSGALLNMCCARLDRQCARMIRAQGAEYSDLHYTRYADDLTFTSSRPFEHAFVEALIRLVLESGFRVNKRKIHRVDTRRGDLVVCGIRIHKGRLTLPRESIRRLRALFWNGARHLPEDLDTETRALIQGSIGFLTMASDDCPAMLAKPLQALLDRHRSWLQPRAQQAIAFPKYGE